MGAPRDHAADKLSEPRTLEVAFTLNQHTGTARQHASAVASSSGRSFVQTRSRSLASLLCVDYPYARPGEVRALTWDDVDLERGVAHIHKSVDREKGDLKGTKTEAPRRIPSKRS